MSFTNIVHNTPSIITHDRQASLTYTKNNFTRQQSPIVPQESIKSKKSILDRRNNAVFELLITEKSYLKGLSVINDIFYSPLLASIDNSNPDTGSILTKKSVKIIFSDFPAIYRLGEQFLQDLSLRLENKSNSKNPNVSTWDSERSTVGDITLKYFPFMKMYSLYLSNYADSLFHFDLCFKENPSFFCFIKNAEKHKECAELTFKSYLLLPVQRIPRYRLLMKTILENTPESHPDYQQTKDSFETIDKVAKIVNDRIREQEMIIKVLEIQKTLNTNQFLLAPGRKLIKQGYSSMAIKSVLDRKKLYLFTDIFMYISLTKLFGGTTSVVIPLEKLSIKTSKIKDQNLIKLEYQNKIISIFLESVKEKQEWEQTLLEAIVSRKSQLNLEFSGNKSTISKGKKPLVKDCNNLFSNNELNHFEIDSGTISTAKVLCKSCCNELSWQKLENKKSQINNDFIDTQALGKKDDIENSKKEQNNIYEITPSNKNRYSTHPRVLGYKAVFDQYFDCSSSIGYEQSNNLSSKNIIPNYEQNEYQFERSKTTVYSNNMLALHDGNTDVNQIDILLQPENYKMQQNYDQMDKEKVYTTNNNQPNLKLLMRLQRLGIGGQNASCNKQINKIERQSTYIDTIQQKFLPIRANQTMSQVFQKKSQHNSFLERSFCRPTKIKDSNSVYRSSNYTPNINKKYLQVSETPTRSRSSKEINFTSKLARSKKKKPISPLYSPSINTLPLRLNKSQNSSINSNSTNSTVIIENSPIIPQSPKRTSEKDTDNISSKHISCQYDTKRISNKTTNCSIRSEKTVNNKDVVTDHQNYFEYQKNNLTPSDKAHPINEFQSNIPPQSILNKRTAARITFRPNVSIE
ncbi:hypothetical protein BB561_001777 [Smittium simulii]|uniref:DH domain-containing protein n=1 Tax=Smittium simulii TaxID=133385 RepID=A0A2T9YT45_9FUNG|nr:hypothetical protein BB561_001777 [Smittium simulii]